jgi:hypothetical protein
MEAERKKLEHQRLKRVSRTHVFMIPNVVMDSFRLREGVDYTLIIIEEGTGEKQT